MLIRKLFDNEMKGYTELEKLYKLVSNIKKINEVNCSNYNNLYWLINNNILSNIPDFHPTKSINCLSNC